MCFSAAASFVVSGSLGLAGAATLQQAKKRSRIPLASIPLLFSVQQAIEGVNWMASPSSWVHVASTYGYAMFSYVLWPAFLPVAVWMIEPRARRKKILSYFICLGIGVSAYFLSVIVRGPVSSIHSACGIVYDIPLSSAIVVPAAYVLATCASCLFSSHKFIRVLGIALFAALFIAYWYYLQAVTSVWCFFAAVLSMLIFVHLRAENKASAPRKRRRPVYR